MATAQVQTQTDVPLPKFGAFKPIIEPPSIKAKAANVEFNPKEHLAYEAPQSVVMMKDIGFGEDVGISPVAVSEPFTLFSPAAIQKFRDEALSEEVVKECSVRSNIAACQIRGYVKK